MVEHWDTWVIFLQLAYLLFVFTIHNVYITRIITIFN